MKELTAMAKSRGYDLDRTTAARLRVELMRFLASRTGDAVLAEDIAQEALLHVVHGLPEYRGDASLGAWARSIALNAWRDHQRRKAARPAERRDAFSIDALLDGLGVAAPAPAAEDVIDRHASHECLLAAARRLPEGPRRVLLLHDFGDMPLEQVAAALGCSIPTAKVRLHRARCRLAALCRAECHAEPGTEGTPDCRPRRSADGPRERKGS